jgi:hypothetical protein
MNKKSEFQGGENLSSLRPTITFATGELQVARNPVQACLKARSRLRLHSPSRSNAAT